jgi:hypothetical protein
MPVGLGKWPRRWRNKAIAPYPHLPLSSGIVLYSGAGLIDCR